jgi:acetolactate synthase-1/2/3 large subunit
MLKNYLHRINFRKYNTALAKKDIYKQLYKKEQLFIENLNVQFNDTILTGAQIVNDTLTKLNIKTVFGYPGGAVLPIFDSIYNNNKFNFILTKHEQGAGHMAQGYAKVSKTPGVVIVTSGPGATNIVTPLQDALMDGIPLIIIAGQVPSKLLGTDAFQEANIIDITKTCTKWNYQVKKTDCIEDIMFWAYNTAMSGRPGPVLIEIPKDVSEHKFQESLYNNTLFGISKFNFPEEKNVKLIDMINNSKRPVIYAGHGSLDAYEEVRKLAINSNIPVTTTLHGLGVFDESHNLSLHMLGMHGSVYANKAMQGADLIISIGARFDDRATCDITKFAPNAIIAEQNETGGIIQFEIEKKQVGKTLTPTLTVIGDAKYRLRELLPHIEKKERKLWFDEIDSWKKEYPYTCQIDKKSKILKPQLVLQEFNKQTNNLENVIITTGVGQHQMMSCKHLTWNKPNTMVTSGGAGTMGVGLPFAIGVKLAKPNSMVVDIDGDGSFCMTLPEMKTAATYNINVKVLLLNNESLGMVSQWQDCFYNKRKSHTKLDNPDFKLLAKSMGWKYIKCSNYKSLSKKMKEFIKYNDGPILAEFVVDPDTHCLPMVKPGGSLDDMIY